MRLLDIIGHKKNITQIINAIENNKFAHAHLIVGEDGIGKSLIAKGMALKILGIDEFRDHVDIIEWKVGKNKSSIGIDDIRTLSQEVNKKPYETDKKVIIVYNSELMTVQAQNAFLKTIEEPPMGVFIILLCDNIESILDTIKSRTQIHSLKVLSTEEVETFIDREYPNIDDIKKHVLVAFSNGIPGRIKMYIEDNDFNIIRDKMLDILKDKNEGNNLLIYNDYFASLSEKWKEAFECILSYIRDMIILKESNIKELVINIDKINQLEELSNMFSFNKLNDIISIIDETRQNLEKNLNKSLSFEVMLLKIQEV